MSRRGSSLSAERYTRFLRALLRPRQANGGWVQVGELAIEADIALATAYRLLNFAEAAGIGLERDTPRNGTTLGVRPLALLVPRDIDRERHQRARAQRTIPPPLRERRRA